MNIELPNRNFFLDSSPRRCFCCFLGFTLYHFLRGLGEEEKKEANWVNIKEKERKKRKILFVLRKRNLLLNKLFCLSCFLFFFFLPSRLLKIFCLFPVFSRLVCLLSFFFFYFFFFYSSFFYCSFSYFFNSFFPSLFLYPYLFPPPSLLSSFLFAN